MSEEDHNLRLLGVLIVAALAILLAMCSCATKTLVERVEVHDTLIVQHYDTTTLYKEKLVHDTLQIVTERIVTLREGGDTIRIVNNNTIREKVVERDSTDRYRVTLDSIVQAIKELDHRKETVTKKRPWWKLPVIISALVLLTAGGVWVITKLK